MLKPYRNNNQKKPLAAKIHFNEGDSFKRIKRMNSSAVCIAAIEAEVFSAHPRPGAERIEEVPA